MRHAAPVAPDLVLRRFGRRFAEIRVARGLTQERLAERARVSVRYVQMIESGGENLSILVAARFSNLLQVPLAELFSLPAGKPTRIVTKQRRPK
jgi:transcriptional regulator with XRE-family HTH domain